MFPSSAAQETYVAEANFSSWKQRNVSESSRANTFWSLNLASERNGSPEDRYFSFCLTHKGLSDHKAT